MTVSNHNGTINITETVFANIVGHVANSCYGVVGMAAKSAGDGIVSLLKKDHYEKGVKVIPGEDGIIVEMHIVVLYGVNLPAVTRSISKEVKYMVEQMTGFIVKKVNIFIDGMKAN
ncbi:MAG: Asp23/Gls24 family envelope stress response protein [Clostridiales bacterium]|nr:MAG: Asp23/Gls24 family envelope stress response protein [Clostridiales bacterium]